MSDIQLSGQGGSVNVGASGNVSGGPVLAAPKTSQDSISSSGGAGAKKGYNAEMTPELMQALYILYYSGNSGPQLVQLMMGNSSGIEKIDPAVFKLEVENKLNAMCINVLNAWSKSIAEEGKRMREEQRSPDYLEWQKQHLKAGYEAYLKTLSPEQRLKVLEYPNYDRNAGINDGTHSMLTSYVEHLRSHPSSSDNLPFMASAITLGLLTRFDYATVPSGESGQIGINPIRDSSSQVMQFAGPTAAELGGYLGSIIVQASSLNATAQALLLPSKATDDVIGKEFAQAFARNILSEVSGPGFAALASGLYVSGGEKGEGLSENRFTNLLRASLLSTGFSLLYATEPSLTVDKGTRVVGGGMTGADFVALANGQVDLTNASKQMQEMYGFVQQTINELGEDKGKFIASFASFIDTHPKFDSWSQLKHIRGLLNPGDIAQVITA